MPGLWNPIRRATVLRSVILVGVLGAAIGVFALGVNHGLSLRALKSHRQELMTFDRASPVKFAAEFFVAYVVLTALSIPAAEILTAAAGALFGLSEGVLLASFASSIGSTLAFCASRYVVRDAVRNRLGRSLRAVNAGVSGGGAAYLFTLRLIPAIPFFVVNLLMGLTEIPVRTFYWVSQIGMLPATLVYVNAGTQLATLHSLSDILSLRLLGSFLLLGFLPLLVRWIRARTQVKSCRSTSN